MSLPISCLVNCYRCNLQGRCPCSLELFEEEVNGCVEEGISLTQAFQAVEDVVKGLGSTTQAAAEQDCDDVY